MAQVRGCASTQASATWAAVAPFREAGIPLAPFCPANVGLSVPWSAPMQRHFGAPLKACTFRAGGAEVRTRQGHSNKNAVKAVAATADGRRVKWGYLYRSGQLSTLSDQDLDLLASLCEI